MHRNSSMYHCWQNILSMPRFSLILIWFYPFLLTFLIEKIQTFARSLAQAYTKMLAKTLHSLSLWQYVRDRLEWKSYVCSKTWLSFAVKNGNWKRSKMKMMIACMKSSYADDNREYLTMKFKYLQALSKCV